MMPLSCDKCLALSLRGHGEYLWIRFQYWDAKLRKDEWKDWVVMFGFATRYIKSLTALPFSSLQARNLS